MKKKKVLCLLCAAAVMLTSIPFAPTRAYASQVNQEESQIGENQSGDATDNGGTEGPTENIWEDETGLYEVLKQDGQGRELVARSGNVYLTTEYDDANSTVTQYCSEGPLEGNNYDRKTTTQQIEENEFHSTTIVTTETASGTTVEEYDGDDNLTRSVAEDGETTVNYYEDGNLVKAIQPYTGTPEDALHTSTYTYDATGNLTKVTARAALRHLPGRRKAFQKCCAFAFRSLNAPLRHRTKTAASATPGRNTNMTQPGTSFPTGRRSTPPGSLRHTRAQTTLTTATGTSR